MMSVEDQRPSDSADRVFSQSVAWYGWKQEGPLVLFVLVGAGTVARRFALCVALIAIATGATGLLLLAKA